MTQPEGIHVRVPLRTAVGDYATELLWPSLPHDALSNRVKRALMRCRFRPSGATRKNLARCLGRRLPQARARRRRVDRKVGDAAVHRRPHRRRSGDDRARCPDHQRRPRRSPRGLVDALLRVDGRAGGDRERSVRIGGGAIVLPGVTVGAEAVVKRPAQSSRRTSRRMPSVRGRSGRRRQLPPRRAARHLESRDLRRVAVTTHDRFTEVAQVDHLAGANALLGGEDAQSRDRRVLPRATRSVRRGAPTRTQPAVPCAPWPRHGHPRTCEPVGRAPSRRAKSSSVAT